MARFQPKGENDFPLDARALADSLFQPLARCGCNQKELFSPGLQFDEIALGIP